MNNYPLWEKYDQDKWNNLEKLKSAAFTCGYCGSKTGNNKGYAWYDNGWGYVPSCNIAIYICPVCGRPVFKENNMYMPGAIYGNEIYGLPDNVKSLYNEARNSYQVNAYTGVVLLCRKLLANVAIHYGAKDGLKFVQYVGYLIDNGNVPPKSKQWVDKIRTEGNKATHNQKLETQENAKTILDFVQMLLMINFQFNDEYSKDKS